MPRNSLLNEWMIQGMPSFIHSSIYCAPTVYAPSEVTSWWRLLDNLRSFKTSYEEGEGGRVLSPGAHKGQHDSEHSLSASKELSGSSGVSAVSLLLSLWVQGVVGCPGSQLISVLTAWAASTGACSRRQLEANARCSSDMRC